MEGEFVWYGIWGVIHMLDLWQGDMVISVNLNIIEVA